MVISRKIFWDKDLAVEEPEPVVPPKQAPKFDLDEVLLPKPVTTIKSQHKTRNLKDDERTTMRVYFIQKEGRVYGDDCVELKTMLSPDLSLWQVTGFISLLHHEVAEGKIKPANLSLYEDWLKVQYEAGLWARYSNPKYVEARDKNRLHPVFTVGDKIQVFIRPQFYAEKFPRRVAR